VKRNVGDYVLKRGAFYWCGAVDRADRTYATRFTSRAAAVRMRNTINSIGALFARVPTWRVVRLVRKGAK
jgi:hypothetical protein